MNNRMERVTHKSVHVFTGMLNHIMLRGALKSQSLGIFCPFSPQVLWICILTTPSWVIADLQYLKEPIVCSRFLKPVIKSSKISVHFFRLLFSSLGWNSDIKTMISIFSCSFFVVQAGQRISSRNFRTFGLSACLLNRIRKKRETKHHAWTRACFWTEQTEPKYNELACLSVWPLSKTINSAKSQKQDKKGYLLTIITL